MSPRVVGGAGRAGVPGVRGGHFSCGGLWSRDGVDGAVADTEPLKVAAIVPPVKTAFTPSCTDAEILRGHPSHSW